MTDDELKAECETNIAKLKERERAVAAAIDSLFRARWELGDDSYLADEETGCVDVSNIDSELDALAEAVGFDRNAAVHRWVAEQIEEEKAAHARYRADGPGAWSVNDSIGSLIRAVAESHRIDDPPEPKKSLVGMAVSKLWEATKR